MTSQQLCIMFNKRFDHVDDSDKHYGDDDDADDGDNYDDEEEDRLLPLLHLCFVSNGIEWDDEYQGGGPCSEASMYG